MEALVSTESSHQVAFEVNNDGNPLLITVLAEGGELQTRFNDEAISDQCGDGCRNNSTPLPF